MFRFCCLNEYKGIVDTDKKKKKTIGLFLLSQSSSKVTAAKYKDTPSLLIHVTHHKSKNAPHFCNALLTVCLFTTVTLSDVNTRIMGF